MVRRLRQSIRLLPAVLLGLAAWACGGSSPAGPAAPLPTSPLTLVFFLDENASGLLDGGEWTRVPGVAVEIGAARATSEVGTGRAILAAVTDGTHSVDFSALPAFFVQPRGLTVQAPQPGGEVAVPLTLPIGNNTPGTYMAFGDSITNGDGSSGSEGYRAPLQAMLAHHFGNARVFDEGVPGTRSNQGADRIASSLASTRAAYTLILYGTNDWNHCDRAVPCFTIDSLATIVREVRAAGSLPFLATIIPANPRFADHLAAERNDWVAAMNDLIRPLARKEGAVLVDLHKAFLETADLNLIFSDYIHPNDAGYVLMAGTFFRAITDPVPVTAAAGHDDPPALLH